MASRACPSGLNTVTGIPAIPDPATALDGTLPLIARQVFDTLVQYRDGSSDIEPGLALRWSPSKDGLSWTFTLRDGVKFHDGTALTAQHVVASLERQLSPDHPLYPNPVAVWPRVLRGVPGVVKEIRALDAKTLQISLVLPYAPLLTVLAHPAFSVGASTLKVNLPFLVRYKISMVSPRVRPADVP